jgi:hypothetical protein
MNQVKKQNGTREEIVIYKTKDKRVKINIKLAQGMIWLTQKQIAELFETERSVIAKHLRNIFKTKELNRNSVCAKIAHTTQNGKTYQPTFYNLDAIISVGCKINFNRATQFRIWAANIFKNYLVKRYTLTQKRLNEHELALKELRETIAFIAAKASHQHKSRTTRKK